MKRKGKLNDREKKHCAALKVDMWPPNVRLFNIHIEAYVLSDKPTIGASGDPVISTQWMTHGIRWRYGRKLKTGLEFGGMTYSAQSHKNFDGQKGYRERDFFMWDLRYNRTFVESTLEIAYRSAKKINDSMRLYHFSAPYRPIDTPEFIAGFADAIGAEYFYFPSNPCAVDEIKDIVYYKFDSHGWPILKREIKDRLLEFHGAKIETQPEDLNTELMGTINKALNL
jgi:hypothetical protein